MNAPTHYDVLNVARNAPPEVIRAAYKVLAQKYHPDRNPGDAEAAEKMKAINTAYEVLSDSQKRLEYDIRLAMQEARSQRTTQTGTPPPFSAYRTSVNTGAAAQQKTRPRHDPPPPKREDIHPWKRFFARTVDLYLAFLLLFFLAKLLPAHATEMLTRAMRTPLFFFAPAALFWMLMEPVFLARYGTTPGKWLFGLRVQRASGGQLSFSDAFARAFLVYALGAGLGIALIALLIQPYAYQRLTRTGTTLWDNTLHVVTHQPVRALRLHMGMLAVLAPLYPGFFGLLRYTFFAPEGKALPTGGINGGNAIVIFIAILMVYPCMQGIQGCRQWLAHNLKAGEEELRALTRGTWVVLFFILVFASFPDGNIYAAAVSFWTFSLVLYAVARVLWDGRWEKASATYSQTTGERLVTSLSSIFLLLFMSFVLLLIFMLLFQ